MFAPGLEKAGGTLPWSLWVYWATQSRLIERQVSGRQIASRYTRFQPSGVSHCHKSYDRLRCTVDSQIDCKEFRHLSNRILLFVQVLDVELVNWKNSSGLPDRGAIQSDVVELVEYG